MASGGAFDKAFAQIEEAHNQELSELEKRLSTEIFLLQKEVLYQKELLEAANEEVQRSVRELSEEIFNSESSQVINDGEDVPVAQNTSSSSTPRFPPNGSVTPLSPIPENSEEATFDDEMAELKSRMRQSQKSVQQENEEAVQRRLQMIHDAMVHEVQVAPPWYVKYVTFDTKHVDAEYVSNHPLFDASTACVISFSAILMGAEVETKTMKSEDLPAIDALATACAIYFMLELVLRAVAQRRNFFSCEARYWNIFDLLLVIQSIVDFITELAVGGDGANSIVGSLKTLKMLRVVRVFRIFRFWRSLWEMALMIVNACKSLFLSMILMSIIVYVFAVCLTMNCSEYLKSQVGMDDSDWLLRITTSTDPQISNMYRFFGSLSRSVYTLVLAVFGGISWYEASDLLLAVDALSPMLMFVYICFVQLAVLNIITGVFVEEALTLAQSQKDAKIQKALEENELYIHTLQHFFDSVDDDGNGQVSETELAAMFQDKSLATHLHILGFETNDARRLFKLLDMDGSGTVSMHEFLEATGKLKGGAKSLDVHEIIYECKKIQRRVRSLMEHSLPHDVFSNALSREGTTNGHSPPGRQTQFKTEENGHGDERRYSSNTRGLNGAREMSRDSLRSVGSLGSASSHSSKQTAKI